MQVSDLNKTVHSILAEMEQFILTRRKWVIPYRLEWNDLFHSDRNEIVYSILARMKWSIPFWPEGNGPFHSYWNLPVHSSWNGMTIPFRLEGNDHSILFHLFPTVV